MQDYQKLYKRKFREKRNQCMLNRIRRIIFSNIPPLLQLAAIIMLVSIGPPPRS